MTLLVMDLHITSLPILTSCPLSARNCLKHWRQRNKPQFLVPRLAEEQAKENGTRRERHDGEGSQDGRKTDRPGLRLSGETGVIWAKRGWGESRRKKTLSGKLRFAQNDWEDGKFIR